MATHGNADFAKSRILSWKMLGLRLSPFDNSFRCNYGSRISHFQTILNKLNAFCNSYENIAVITGISGVGKTLMLNDFMQENSEPYKKIIITADLSVLEILNKIASSLNLNLVITGDVQEDHIEQLADILLREERKFILICDDAHKLSQEAFHAIIELITNAKTSGCAKALLLGNASIFERVMKCTLDKGNAIKLMHYIMEALPKEQLKLYLHSCLAKSGWPGALPEIPSNVINKLFEESDGIPRLVNIAAERTLLEHLLTQNQNTQEKIPKPKHNKLKSINQTIKNHPATTIVTLGFMIMLYGNYILYQDHSTTVAKHDANIEAEQLKMANLAGYTIQLGASSNLAKLINFKDQQHLEKEMYIYETSRQGKPWYILVYGSFITKEAATSKLRELQKTKKLAGLWVKPFLDIQLSSKNLSAI